MHKIFSAAKHEHRIANSCFIHKFAFWNGKCMLCFSFEQQSLLATLRLLKRGPIEGAVILCIFDFKGCGNLEYLQWMQVLSILKAQMHPGLTLLRHSYVKTSTKPTLNTQDSLSWNYSTVRPRLSALRHLLLWFCVKRIKLNSNKCFDLK